MLFPHPTRDGVAAEVRATLRLAAPLIASQLAAVGQNVVDIMLAGHLGAHVLGAVAVGTNVWSLALMTTVGMMMALSPSVAQLDGARRRDEIGPLFRQALWLALGAGLLFMAAVYLAGPKLVAAMGIAPALIPDVTAFLHAVSFAAPAVSLYMALRGLSEGLSLPRPSMLFSLLGLILLAPIGYVLMYQVGLGAFGSGIAMSVVCWLQLLGFAAYVRRHPRYRRLGWERGRRGPDPAAIAGLLRLGGPMAVSVLMEVGLFSGAALFVARFGETAVASHQVALSVASVTFMVPLGIALATTVRVGNAAGRGDRAGVRRAGFIGIGLAVACQAVAALVMLVLPLTIAGLYTGDPAVLQTAAGLLFLAALFQLSDGIQVASAGALRGLKDARLPMLITIFSYWAVGMPTGWFLAFAQDWRTPGMWVGLIAGLTCAAGLLLARFHMLSRGPSPIGAAAVASARRPA
ncbi:MATE family efflux transporter [Limobrevibacterium gyesilva]|uniref:Multidrug-efflux transporter n=1 Tax=Limobrevibacterium gyesilva TaxID=2991712 RepID=A0AA42CGF2_9PROT|nr:MATE family efflux transporter [Limobrevibacterium gyesilva]MCW3473780.1 MATE family efflux transporter [Limobrevibacterium gyesilva]